VYELGLFLSHSIMMNSVAKPASSWSTKILQFEGSFFFVRSEKKDGNYTVDVVMKGSQEDCEHFMVEASLLNVESGKSAFKASFQPRPLTNQNEFIYSLSVPESGKTVFKSLFQPSSFVMGCSHLASALLLLLYTLLQVSFFCLVQSFSSKLWKGRL
jgi:hypothetical protein